MKRKKIKPLKNVTNNNSKTKSIPEKPNHISIYLSVVSIFMAVAYLAISFIPNSYNYMSGSARLG